LGRAYLLSEDYKNAWINFDKAKKVLPQVKDENKAMLANEIALGLSIVNIDGAKRYFKSEKENLSQPNTQNQTSNTNTTPDTEIKPLTNQNTAPTPLP
jgi:hypothetical protein